VKEPGTPKVVRPARRLMLQDTAQPEAPPSIPRPAQKSRFRQRHLKILLSFALMILVPVAASGWYLWVRAVDQYASNVGFSVRSEEQGSAIDTLLGPLDLGGGSSAPDAEVLYQFIQSQGLVAKVDAKLDLRALWSKPGPENDPVYAYHPPGTIEDLLAHWHRKVKIYYDSGTGLIELKVLAFDPNDAQRIAEEIFVESTAMINELSAVAREDAIRYARDELEKAVERLKVARAAVTQFRNRTQIVDPTIDVQGQASILNSLNQQLATAMIEMDMLRETTRAGDPRIAQADRRIRVIEVRIEDEKRKLGIGGTETQDDVFAALVGEYESLVVDREFAEQTYTAALAAYDSALAEAQRQTRYLAAHVRPTLAERAQYPERTKLLGLIALFSFLIWAILVLAVYSLRDRN
jgi:capsular polysaccharide transport system permease protein